MTQRLRSFLLAGFLAPLAGGLWGGVFIAVMSAVTGETFRWPSNFITLLAIATLYGAVLAFLLTWTVGAIWHAIACKINWRGLAPYLSFGSAAGALIALGILAASQSTPTVSAVFAVVWLASTGMVVAVVGWLIRRPDRDAPNPDKAAP